MSVARLFIPVVAVASLLSAGFVGAQPAPESAPILKPARERGAPPSETQPVVNEAATERQRLSLCIESWDAETHMSKQEWRAACQRSVRAQPDAFGR
jgi:hypothetical protein